MPINPRLGKHLVSLLGSSSASWRLLWFLGLRGSDWAVVHASSSHLKFQTSPLKPQLVQQAFEPLSQM